MTVRRPTPAPPRQAIQVPRSRPRGFSSLKAVGSFVPGLTRKAFEKYGFSAASLITDWPAIAGRELAQYTAPERLKWPRAAARFDDAGDIAEAGRPSATLLLRVDGARALDVQYGARQIIERINSYFGYAAVAELRIVQAPVGEKAGQDRAEPRKPDAPLTAEVASVADTGLRSALGRLGAAVRQKGHAATPVLAHKPV
jgi:hypothetical protein